VAGAFILENVEDLAERHLLLVDDVLTTGSTVNEVCRLLRRKSEVGQIMVLTVARAPLVDQL
jgi:predicted amidophosphoribosyltransferase